MVDKELVLNSAPQPCPEMYSVRAHAAAGSVGRVVVVWSVLCEDTAAEENEVVAAVVDESAGKAVEQIVLASYEGESEGGTAMVYGPPLVALTQSGGALAVWLKGPGTVGFGAMPFFWMARTFLDPQGAVSAGEFPLGALGVLKEPIDDRWLIALPGDKHVLLYDRRFPPDLTTVVDYKVFTTTGESLDDGTIASFPAGTAVEALGGVAAGEDEVLLVWTVGPWQAQGGKVEVLSFHPSDGSSSIAGQIGGLDADQAFNPTVAAMEDGRAVLTYLRVAQATRHIEGRFVDFASGEPLLQETTFVVSEGDIDESAHPQVGGLVGGGFVVSWEALSANGRDVIARMFDSSGVPAGTAFKVNSEYVAGHLPVEELGLPVPIGADGGGGAVVWRGVESGLPAGGQPDKVLLSRVGEL
jgi:hypothetical protein